MARTSGSDSKVTGRKIESAALRLFAQHGYAAVSMRQIATEVGVQVGALYNYTPDKQSLLFGLMKTHMDSLAAARADTSEPVNNPIAALEAFVRFHVRFHRSRPDAVFIAYMELRNLTDENFAIIEDARRAYENGLERILKRGQEAGVFKIVDTRVTTRALIAMLTGLNTWFREDGRLSFAQIEDLYLDMAMKLIGIASI